MSEQQPQTNNPPPLPGGGRQQSTKGGDASYDFIADKVGGVPNLRKKDNLFQGIAIVACLFIGMLAGWLVGGDIGGVLAGAFIGIVAGTLISGTVLMVMGLMRKSINR